MRGALESDNLPKEVFGLLACGSVGLKMNGRRLLAAAALCLGGCTTVEPGQDFNIAEVVYDENFFYCAIEPMMFSQSCGPGDTGKGDASGSCHFNVTSYRLRDYSPLVFASCNGIQPGAAPPPAAQGNYQASQIRMAIDPDRAQLLIRPIGNQTHPRKIFDSQSPEADLIRQWATQYSSQ